MILKAREELRQNREFIQKAQINEVTASKRRTNHEYEIGLQVLRIGTIPNNHMWQYDKLSVM
jgi:hypothetical protein